MMQMGDGILGQNLGYNNGGLLLRFVTPMNDSLVIMEGSSLQRFVNPLNGSLVIMEGSLLLRSFSDEWYPCHYGR